MMCKNPIRKQDKLQGWINVPCGSCLACKSNRKKEWSFRLYQEYKNSLSAYFLTLTYSNENLPTSVDTETGEIAPTLYKDDIQLFLKRLRRHQEELYKRYHKISNIKQARQKAPQIRYYACGEYGENTKRPHYHMILFNLEPELQSKILDIWNLGFVHIGTANAKTIAYTLKYVLKGSLAPKPWLTRPFSLMSRRPPIGQKYLDNNGTYHKLNRDLFVRSSTGAKQKLPRFYREKIFTKVERKIINSEIIGKMSELDKKYEEKMKKLGRNPEVYKREMDQDQERKLIKQNKKEKL